MAKKGTPSFHLGFLPVIIGVLAIASGCIPVTGTYYRPSANKGKIDSYSHCGPPDTLILSRKEVTILITSYFLSTQLPAPDGNSIHVAYRVPELRTVTFQPAGLKITTQAGNNISMQAKIKAVIAPGRGENVLASKNNVHLYGNAHMMGKHHYSEYTTIIEFIGAVPKRFDLIFPAMEIADKKFAALHIRFAKEKTTWLAGVQCP